MKKAYPSPLEISLGLNRTKIFEKSSGGINEYNVLSLDTSKETHVTILYPTEDSSNNPIDQNRLRDEQLKVRLVKNGDVVTGIWNWEDRTPESKTFFLSDIKSAIASDLIENGIPVKHFYDEKVEFFFKTKYSIKKTDLKLLDLYRTPGTSYNQNPFGNSYPTTLSILSEENLYFPAMTDNGFKPAHLSNMAGAALLDAYYAAIKDYRTVLMGLMLDLSSIQEHTELSDVWEHVYGVTSFVGETKRIKF